jgi:hypothetical protein
MLKILFVLAINLIVTTVLAHGGGLDQSGCHNTKTGGRHCHGENTGKYIPMSEEMRLKKLHKDTCNSIDAEGRKVKVDLYSKRCR